jgi:hypothetical protein
MMSNPFFDMYGQEDEIAEMPGVHRWTEDAPVRFEIMKEKDGLPFRRTALMDGHHLLLRG